MDQVRAWTEGIPMNTLYNLITGNHIPDYNNELQTLARP